MTAPLLALALALASGSADGEPERAVLQRHAELVHATYRDVEASAVELREALRSFTADPTPESLEGAKAAWRHSHAVYAPSEAFRFYGGPIDDAEYSIETLVNGWPLDEAYVDYVVGDPEAGIINRVDDVPGFNRDTLVDLNERNGEKNISTGYHAIEFLLWGQDLDPEGPGARPFIDYVDGEGAPNAERRRLYLEIVADLLLEHAQALTRSWRPKIERNYAGRFVADDPRASLRKVFTGIVMLGLDELAAERLAVAYETRDQEEETSCFSDTTLVDLVGNAVGIEDVYLGRRGDVDGPGLDELVAAKDAGLDGRVRAALRASVEALEAIPAPFDQAFLGEDDSEGRVRILAAIEALEYQSLLLIEAAEALGLRLDVAR